MKKYIFLSILTAAAINSSPAVGQMNMNNSGGSSSTAAFQLKTAMRQLWEDHVTWTRNVILCLTDDLPGTDQAVKRLFKNQDDIGNAVSSFYGQEAGKKLTALLYDHINIAAEVVQAARAGNTQKLDDANKRWFANADEISEFLSKANSNWVLADMKKMMHDHLQLTTDEAVSRLKRITTQTFWLTTKFTKRSLKCLICLLTVSSNSSLKNSINKSFNNKKQISWILYK